MPATLLWAGRYLDAIRSRDLHDPPGGVLTLEDERSPITVHRFTYLLEEPLVQAPGRLGYQHPAHALAYDPVGVQSSFVYVYN